MQRLNKKIGSLELRTTGKNLARWDDGEPDTRIEIVKWADSGRYCWTIAYWNEDASFHKIEGRCCSIDKKAFKVLKTLGDILFM